MDIAITSGGDFLIDGTSDLLVRSDAEELADDVTFRLRTYLSTYSLRPEVGTELEDLIGQPNTRATLHIGELDIARALTYDGLVSPDELDVTGIPVNTNEALFAIRIYRYSYESPIIITVPFSFKEGFLDIL